MYNLIFTCAVTTMLLLSPICTAPLPQNDIDYGSMGIGGGSGNSQPVDYNTVMGHFKDFFMYLPVMMTTLKETMSGFPKFAEGVRILTSKNGRIEGDCNCEKNSNEIENNSRYG